MSRRVARAVAGKADGAWHWAWLAWVALAATLVSMLRAHWPEFYEFAALPSISGWSRLVHTPVHLDDDVMIALRSGYMVEQVDMPSYNRGDVAQPATSYLAPYFFLLLYKLLPGYLPGYLPVLAYALLGVAGVGLTMSALVWSAASRPVLATVLVMLLLCTRTNAVFALSGWDHLFQALLLTVAVVMVLRRGRSAAFYAGAVGLAAAGALYRPDGLLIALAVLAVGAVHAPQRRGAMLCGLVFVGLIGAAMVVNWLQFGQLTPTTARLKIGASPSLHYSLNYLYVNGWRRFSAITLCGVLTLVLLWRAQRLPGAVRTILAACLATLGLTTLNSDVFSGARMFWMPACVLSALVLSTASARPGGAPIATGTTIMPGARRDTMLAAIGLAVLVALAWRLPAKSPHVVRVDAGHVAGSYTAPQYVLTQWIDAHLAPSDGAVGLYWLGMGYYLPRFEIADFLGKADELIARQPVKWGPPGHNKWDTDATVRKWRPQVIIPTLPPPWDGDFKAYRAHLAALTQRREGWGFVHDLVLSQVVAEQYRYCYIGAWRGIEDRWGMYIRRDVAARHAAQLRCRQD